jgi:hypothetical protein
MFLTYSVETCKECFDICLPPSTAFSSLTADLGVCNAYRYA